MSQQEDKRTHAISVRHARELEVQRTNKNRNIAGAAGGIGSAVAAAQLLDFLLPGLGTAASIGISAAAGIAGSAATQGAYDRVQENKEEELEKRYNIRYKQLELGTHESEKS